MRAAPKLNIGLALASIVLSVLMWLHVQSQEELKVARTVTLPVVPVNLDESRYLVRLPENLQVSAMGTLEDHQRLSDFLASQRGKGVVATVDFRDAQPDVASYRARIQGLDDLVRLGIEIGELPELVVAVQEIAVRSFEVRAVPTNVPEGFVFSQAEIRPSRVEIRGAESDLARIAEVRVLLNLTDYRPGQPLVVQVEALDSQSKPLSSPTVSIMPLRVRVVPSLAVAPPERSLFVSLRLAPGTNPQRGYRLTGYTLSPLTVMATGDARVLQRLQSVSTEPVSLRGLQTRTVRRVRLIEPEGVELRVDRVEVALEIEPIPPVVAPPAPAPANPAPNPTTGSSQPG